MLTRRETTTTAGERPFNNLLRRLSDADYALLALHLTQHEAEPNELLYSPGDDVETVHFPCGPSLVSYMVPNEDGRDVETILIGREGAVGGIVSQGYLPAYTRIAVKFGGPFARLNVGKLRLQHGAYGSPAFLRRNIPGESDEIAPVTVFMKEVDHAIEILTDQGGGEIIEPATDELRRRGSGVRAHARPRY